MNAGRVKQRLPCQCAHATVILSRIKAESRLDRNLDSSNRSVLVRAAILALTLWVISTRQGHPYLSSPQDHRMKKLIHTFNAKSCQALT
jgi:hypothetical protein